MPSLYSPSDTRQAELSKFGEETLALTGVGPLLRDRITRPEVLVLLAATLALLAKLYCAWTTVGTSDAVLFRMFGADMGTFGLVTLYNEEPLFNHTPVVGYFCRWAHSMETQTDVAFTFMLRVPGIFADFGAVFCLLWLHARTGLLRLWAIGVFALSPVAFMTAGYHGNLDSVLTFLLLVAACACISGRWVWCALAFALACQVKVVPLLLAPAFFFYWWPRKRAWRFAASVGVLVLGGWIEPLIQCPDAFLRNVLGYKSYWGIWGITWALRATGFDSFHTIGFTGLHSNQNVVMTTLKYFVIGSVIWVAWARRHTVPIGIFVTLALTWAVFFCFSPGVGGQYLIWFTPFVLVASPRWYLALTVACSIFLFVFYNVISNGMPWYIGMPTDANLPGWINWNVIPWLTMIGYLFWALREVIGKATLWACSPKVDPGAPSVCGV